MTRVSRREFETPHIGHARWRFTERISIGDELDPKDSAPAPFLPPPWDTGDAGPRIRDVRVILTAPDDIRLVVVKIETDEPGLYGLGCATFTQRPLAVVTAIEQYLRPQVIGR